ncbi:MAG: carboxypeptidase-like regulatory domain-containing protein [Thermoanaerobaculia bacterium]
MPKRLIPMAVALTLVYGNVAEANLRLSDFMQVLGSVRTTTRPVDEALVIAFNLADYKTDKTWSSPDGAFRLPPLRAGIYRIIAVKQGFVPAVATIVPNRRSQTLTLKLEAERVLSETERDQIWQIRRSLPPDVLRELNAALASVSPAKPDGRFGGEMASMADFAADGGGVAQTELGMRGVLSDGVRVNFLGRLELGSDTANTANFPGAEGSDVAMTIEQGGRRTYNVASSRNSWTRAEADAGNAIDTKSHQIEVRSDRDSLRVRYFAQENLFAERGFDSELFEVVGERRIWSSGRGDADVRVRLQQERPINATSATPIYRVADFAASANHAIGGRVELGYTLHARVAGDGDGEYAPESHARFRVGKNTTLTVSGLYKTRDGGASPYPSVVVFDQEGIPPRYRYTVGIEQNVENEKRFIALFSVEEVDSHLRIVFDDRFGQAWDGFYMQAGDVRRDLTLAYRTRLGEQVVFDLKADAGDANAADGTGPARSYVSAAMQTHIRPSGTTFDLGYRYIDQPLADRLSIGSEAERLNIRMAQSLHLPLDLRVLVGIDLARSPDSLAAPGEIQKRLLGGISFAF